MRTEKQYLELMREQGMPMLVSKKATAKELSISQMTLDRLRKEGEILPKKVGGQIMFPLDEIARFLAEV